MADNLLEQMAKFAAEFETITPRQVQATQSVGQTTGNEARRIAALRNQFLNAPPVEPTPIPQAPVPSLQAPLNATPSMEFLASQLGPAPMDYQALLNAIYSMQRKPATPFVGGAVNPFLGGI